MTDPRTLRFSFLLLLTAAIWGFAFVAQRVGMEFLGPFSFNGIRFLLGGLSLLPLVLIFKPAPSASKTKPSGIWLAGGLLGLVLFGGASLQQIGLIWTTAGKAAFITGLYIVLVPLVGIFIGHPPKIIMIIGAVLAIVGLFLLSVTAEFTIGPGDLWVLIGAFFWTGHILLINHFAARYDALRLSLMQVLVCGMLSLAIGFGFEKISLEAISQSITPLLFGGICSVGIAYTLQMFGQKHVPPGPAVIILSMETVFAALGGWMILNEQLSTRGLVGCGLILAGMLLSQWRLEKTAQPEKAVL